MLDNDLYKARLNKLEELRKNNIEPFPTSYNKTHSAVQAVEQLTKIETTSCENQVKTQSISIAGRITRFRKMGGTTFIDLKDQSGHIQLIFRKNFLESSYQHVRLLDVGDWLGAVGPVFRTKTGEATVEVHEWQILSKAIRPLPEKWHGLTDIELRYRQRYLDLISNQKSLDIAILRSKTIKLLRQKMDSLGFTEVETPVLVPIPAGASATPFITHHNALNRDLYLRIATELYLKRIIVGGIEKVYEIGKVFRNEGLDFYHNPEFTMMESYQAFADYEQVMTMVESLVHDLALNLTGDSKFEFENNTIDLTPPWNRLDLREAIKSASGIDYLEHLEIEHLSETMRDKGLDTGNQTTWAGLMDKLISLVIEPNLIQPTFLVNYPVAMSPLAKKSPQNPLIAERFEGFVGGMEICNAFSELNDPVDQRIRLEQQESLRSKFKNVELDRLDEDFIVALEHGMPPTGGLGLGIDRLIMIFSSQRSIREVVLFPQLKS
ncbi:MAG: lysine--tRNA ligase [SAR202 cluster bacterium]|nr:lysine--tRNA ligase [Chloroflexota bacterium]MQG39804.1 lysine--tRNA ligase [SAR202 cluster bacterium]|tara:strand:+ start:2049 stop:3527 length:1479 start_codon:yes stop_codon:yes gene_type:complete